MRMLITFLEGIIVGTCNIIPGVSGGTLIVIFNIYNQFLELMSLNIKKIIKNWKFAVPLILGICVGIVGFSKLISILYINFPVQTNYFFTGLILGSIPLLFSYIYKKEEKGSFKIGQILGIVLCFLAGVSIIVAFSILQKHFGNTTEFSKELPTITAVLIIKIFVAGILGAIAMIVPGVSGSLLMLILGVYPIIINAIANLLAFNDSFVTSVLLLIPTGFGVLAGLLLGSRAIKLLLEKCPKYTYGVILGLIVGSIINIFPGFTSFTGIGMTVVSFICLIAGAAAAFFSTKISR